MRSTVLIATRFVSSAVLVTCLAGCASDSGPSKSRADASSGGAEASNGGAAGAGGNGSGGAPSSGGVTTTGGARGSGGAGAGRRDGGAVDGGSDGSVPRDGAARADGGAGAHDASSDAGDGGPRGDSPSMPIPPVLAPTSTDATTDYYSMTVKAGETQMRAGAPTPIVGFEGVFPGPTIVATKGRTVQVTQTNGWTENITIHNHGHKVAASSDGHPIDYITPGKSKVYTYPNDQNASTYWYHDHAMDLTGPHVYGGLAGFYIIHDVAEDALKLPSGKYEVPILIQDKTLNDDNTLFYTAASNGPGFMGKLGVVNGVVSPHFDVDSHKYRFRLLNGSNARIYKVALRSGRPFQVVGSDGGLLSAPVSVTALGIAPAERYDVVVDFSQDAVGTVDALVNTDTSAPVITDLVELRVTDAVHDDSTVPSTLAPLSRLQEADSAGTATWTLSQDASSGGGTWVINDDSYDPARLDQVSHLGSIYVWTLINASTFVHPFHKHLSEFQILDIDGQPPPPEQGGWKDTVQVPVGSAVRVIFADQTFTGTYVFHCHILEHEDHRMMLQESVVSP